MSQSVLEWRLFGEQNLRFFYRSATCRPKGFFSLFYFFSLSFSFAQCFR